MAEGMDRDSIGQDGMGMGSSSRDGSRDCRRRVGMAHLGAKGELADAAVLVVIPDHDLRGGERVKAGQQHEARP